MNTIPDDIDLTQYLRAAEDLRVLVRPASSYADKLRAEFAPRDQERRASMFSTKLRDRIQFRPGEVTVWAGYNGHRKSMFTGQIALDMLVQRESVLMASFEMAPERTLARMGRQAWGMEFLSPNHQATFLAWAERLSIFDHKGTISPERCTAVCRYFAEELKGRHAFIDSMMMVCSSEEHLDEQKRFMTGMVRLAIETGLHIHLVAHCRKPTNEGTPPTKYDLRGSAAISDQADNVVMVWSDQAKKHAETKDRQKPDALVSVEKQRNGRWEGKAQLWFHDQSLRFTDGDEDFVDPYAGLQ
jgi:twinkle protein